MLALLIGAALRASDPWSAADVRREVAVVAVSVADWAQTLDLVRAQERGAPGEELNPFLGPRPSRGAVNRWFAASILCHVLVVGRLPVRWRPAFQHASFGWELAIVGHNARVGLRVSF